MNPPCADDPEQEAPLVRLTGLIPHAVEFCDEVLVTVWWDGTGELAFRTPAADTWGPPSPLTKVDD